MRSAFCDRSMVRFEAPHLVGVAPTAGRVIQRVEGRGRHLEIEWDDGVVLHTNLRRHGTWHLHQPGQHWQGRHDDLSVLIEAGGWVAVCFRAAVVETFRHPNIHRHPGLGRIGPDLARPSADLERCVEALAAIDDPRRRLHDVLLDERYFRGLGGVLRNELLWVAGLSPFAHVGELERDDLARLVQAAARLVRHQLGTVECRRAVYAQSGRPCPRCQDTIQSMPVGAPARTIYWCDGCQRRLDPRADETPPAIDRHPAATRYLNELSWRRTG